MPTGAADAATPDRQTCRVDAWPVFVNGLHKGENYPPGQLDRMVENFARLSGPDAEVRGVDGGPWLEAPAKLGHNARQRAKASLGFPAFGRVTRVERGSADGWLRLWLDEVPARVGGWINGRLLRSGSIELKDSVPDPRDPAKPIPGPILTGVGFLGEEPPAVPGGGKLRAVFADGSPVPPDTDPVPLMAAIAAGEPDDATPDYSLAFSDDTETPTPEPPVDKTAIVAAFKALPPEEQAAALAEMSAAPAAGAVLSGDPAAKPAGGELPPEMKAMADEVKKCMSDLTARVGAIEGDSAKKMADAAEDKEKAFAAEFDRQVERHELRVKVEPYKLAILKDQARDIYLTRAFSDGAARTKAFSDHFAPFAALPVNPALRSTVADGGPKGAELTTGGRATLKTLQITNPRAVERLAAAGS